MKIVLLGAPNSGKGSTATRLSSYYNVPHISTGDIFRRLAEEGSELGVKARDMYWKHGKLVPDDITIKLVEEMLTKPEYQKGFIMEGFPRTVDQAKALDDILHRDYMLINLDVSDETLQDRVEGRIVCSNKKCSAIYHVRNMPPKQEGICDKCRSPLYKREDDKPEVFKQRLEVYNKQTKPVLKYYKKRVIHVSGEDNVDSIVARIKQVIGN